jgi:DNA repair protein RadC
MEKQIKMNGTWDSENFGDSGRHYFLDVKKAKNNTHYLRITRSDVLDDHKCNRSSLIFFEEDLKFLVEALSMVLGRWTHSELETLNT